MSMTIRSASEDEGIVLSELKLPALQRSIHDFESNAILHGRDRVSGTASRCNNEPDKSMLWLPGSDLERIVQNAQTDSQLGVFCQKLSNSCEAAYSLAARNELLLASDAQHLSAHGRNIAS